MACTCVVGLQWGDEAKGKIVDLLTPEHHVVVRYNGGANAGHTVVRDGKTYKLSLLPTGVLKPNILSVIGNGLVVYPPRLLEEIDNLCTAGVRVGAIREVVVGVSGAHPAVVERDDAAAVEHDADRGGNVERR